MTSHVMEWRFHALTHIWTGDAERQGNRLIPTSLMGSIRWWFEVLVRGLGGKACDPTSNDVRCPAPNRQPTEHGHHCVVCELFGCTGWARKFRLMVLDGQGQIIIKDQITAGQRFTLRFVPLRPIREEEWCLLDLTLRLIADYGAIGGRTVLKPSDEPNRQDRLHHKDYGLIQYKSGPANWSCSKTREELEQYVSDDRWRRNFNDEDLAWASLKNFWYVKGRYLARQSSDKSTFNKVVGRKQQKSDAQSLEKDNRINRWLAGRQQESKKVFSFKPPKEGRRTFGFVKPDTVDFDEIKNRLAQAWPGFQPDSEFKMGQVIVDDLFDQVLHRRKHS